MKLRPGHGPYHCKNHPGVNGIGFCKGCSQVVCEPCATRFSRVLFCRDCVAAKSNEKESRGLLAVGDSVPACLLFLLFGFVGVTSLLYLAVQLAR